MIVDVTNNRPDKRVKDLRGGETFLLIHPRDSYNPTIYIMSQDKTVYISTRSGQVFDSHEHGEKMAYPVVIDRVSSRLI